ncbi:MAG TPA: hypothetical protein DCQ84_13985 [Candidatus Competibacteraceae bacterium]|nr:hypothetical protein [Candidatus Competibacteraceae bacterium]
MAEKLNDLIVARTEKTTPANADKIPILDSADTHKFRWLSWSGLLAWLSTAFDQAGTASAAVSAHVAAVDPHPIYTTAAEAAAAAPVQSVAGRTGAINLAIGDVAALQTALDGKAPAAHNQAASTITDFAEAVDDRVAALLVAGANVTLSYNDATNTLTVSATGGGSYTDEQAQDAVGAILTDSATVDFTYDDAANTITAAAKAQQSITADASGLKLAGDAAAPGNSRLYGTDGAGAKGWFAQPVAPVQSVAGKTGTITLAAADIAGLGSASTLNVGTTAGTVAAGDHAHAGTYDPAGTASSAVSTHAALTQAHGISAFGATLVDDASAPAARTTLGLGSAATLSVGTAANNLVQLDSSAKLPAVDGSQLTGLPSAGAPSVVTVTSAAGVANINTAGSSEVVAKLTLSENVTSIALQSVAQVCNIKFEVTQPANSNFAFPVTVWPNGTIVAAHYLYPATAGASATTVFWWSTTDHGATARVESNAPFSISRTPTITAGAITVDAAGISDVTINLALTANVSSIALQNVPADCRMRFVVTQSGGPWSIAASAWPAGTIVQPHALAPTGTTVIEWETRDGGTSALARAPAAFAPALALLPLSPLIPLPAGRWFDQGLLSAAHGTLIGVAGRVDVCGLLRPFDVAINQAGVDVTTAVAAATGRVVIYAATSAGVPGPLLYLGTEDLDLSTVGFKFHTLAFTFQAGKLYYVGFIHGGTAVIRAIQGYSLPAFGLASSTSAAPLSVLSQTVTYPNAPVEFAFDASAHLAARAAPSVRMRVA